MNPFEYANDLMIKESYDVDIEQRKDYKEFLINRSLSYQPDLIYVHSPPIYQLLEFANVAHFSISKFVVMMDIEYQG